MTPTLPGDLPAWMGALGPTGRPASGRTLRPQGEDMAGRLLDAGRQAFWERGYEAARIDDVVDLVGASHGTFYLYFRNKEDLLHRLALETADDLRRLTAALEALPAPLPEADLVSWLEDFIGSYRRNGPVLRVWLDRRDLDPLMQSLASDVLGTLVDALARRGDARIDEAIGGGLMRMGLLSLVERLAAYQRTSHDIDPRPLARTEARLLSGLLDVTRT